MIRRIFCALLFLVLLVLFAQVPVQIRTNNVKARRLPNSQAPVVATLHAGEVFVIKDDKPYWYEIALQNGNLAWVRKASCTVVDPAPSDDSGDVSNPPACSVSQQSAPRSFFAGRRLS